MTGRGATKLQLNYENEDRSRLLTPVSCHLTPDSWLLPGPELVTDPELVERVERVSCLRARSALLG